MSGLKASSPDDKLLFLPSQWYAALGIRHVMTLGALSMGIAAVMRKLTIEDTGLPGSSPSYGNMSTVTFKQVSAGVAAGMPGLLAGRSLILTCGRVTAGGGYPRVVDERGGMSNALGQTAANPPCQPTLQRRSAADQAGLTEAADRMALPNDGSWLAVGSQPTRPRCRGSSRMGLRPAHLGGLRPIPVGEYRTMLRRGW